MPDQEQNEQAASALDELVNGEPETQAEETAPAGEQAETAPAQAEAQSPAAAESDGLEEAIAADPELAAKLEYAHKLDTLGKKDAAQKLFDEINVALGVSETEAEPAKAEPPPLLRKQAENEAFDQEIAWQGVLATIDAKEAQIKSQQEEIIAEYNQTKADLETAAGQTFTDEELKRFPAIQRVGTKWANAREALQKEATDRQFVSRIEKIVTADPDLKRVKTAYLHAAYNKQVNPYAPKAEQIRQLTQLGIIKATPAARAKINPAALERMRNKNAPKVGQAKGPSTGGAPSKAKVVNAPAVDARKLAEYARYGMKHLGVAN